MEPGDGMHQGKRRLRQLGDVNVECIVYRMKAKKQKRITQIQFTIAGEFLISAKFMLENFIGCKQLGGINHD